MSALTITKDNTGKLVGVTEADKKAYARFQKHVRELEPGEIYNLSVHFPRNPAFHKKHMAMLAAVFAQQEQFDDFDQGFRRWAQIGAGHYDTIPGPHGRMIDISKSIAWDKMDDAELEEHHEAVKAFLRSRRATDFMWPNLSEQQQVEMISGLLDSFDGNL